jgi:hypothetical protein
MDLKTQEKISKLMTEQADKLGKALSALRRISALANDDSLTTAKKIADETQKEIARYGKNPKDL